MQKKPIPHINVPIMTKNGSMELAWYLFLQWVSENASAADLSDYFTKEETEALLATKADIDGLADVAFSGSYNDLSNKPTFANTDLSNLTTTGEAKFTVKANTDMDNLTGTGQNIANWSTNVSNCITKIPQDIKLELNNGTLILKAGSKVHLANGDLDATNTITTDITYTNIYDDQYILICTGSSLQVGSMNSCFSGTIANRPSSLLSNAGLYFATDQNVIYLTGDGGTSWYSGPYYTLPLAIITVSGGAISSIDQVFNGFGYIGSTVFALPGLKGLIPDGRNADGSLKNTEIAINTVQTLTPTASLNMEVAVVLGPQTRQIQYCGDPIYNEAENLTYDLTTKRPYCLIGWATLQSSKITSFTPKTTFHAVDYSNSGVVVAEQLPTSANNYTWYRKYANGWVEQGRYFTNSTTIQYGGQGDLGSFTFPVPMANTGYHVDASGQGYCVLMQMDKSTTYCKPIFGAYSMDRTLSSVSVYVCGMAA